MVKQRNIRKRRAVEDEDEISDGGEQGQKPLSAEEIKLLQKQRHRKTVRSRITAINNKFPHVIPTINAFTAATTATGWFTGSPGNSISWIWSL